MYQCHKYGFKLSTTEFNEVFRTASVIPADRKPFKIHYFCIENLFENLLKINVL